MTATKIDTWKALAASYGRRFDGKEMQPGSAEYLMGIMSLLSDSQEALANVGAKTANEYINAAKLMLSNAMEGMV